MSSLVRPIKESSPESDESELESTSSGFMRTRTVDDF